MLYSQLSYCSSTYNSQIVISQDAHQQWIDMEMWKREFLSFFSEEYFFFLGKKIKFLKIVVKWMEVEIVELCKINYTWNNKCDIVLTSMNSRILNNVLW